MCGCNGQGGGHAKADAWQLDSAETDSKHKLPIAPNLLNREFTLDAPDRVWTSDITCIATSQGWLYLAVVIDLFSRPAGGWLWCAAAHAGQPGHGCQAHDVVQAPDSARSDLPLWGSQYCGNEFPDAFKGYGMTSSMSCKSNCRVNAPTESLWGRLKVGRLYGKTFATQRDATRWTSHRLVDLLQPSQTSLHIGLRQPDAI